MARALDQGPPRIRVQPFLINGEIGHGALVGNTVHESPSRKRSYSAPRRLSPGQTRPGACPDQEPSPDVTRCVTVCREASFPDASTVTDGGACMPQQNRVDLCTLSD